MITDGPGYLITARPEHGRRSWTEYETLCRHFGVPGISVTKATYWKLTVTAASMPAGTFTADDIAWFQARAAAYLQGSESTQPRLNVRPIRLQCFGLSQSNAISLASEIERRFLPTQSNIVDLTSERIRRCPPKSLRARVRGGSWEDGPA